MMQLLYSYLTCAENCVEWAIVTSTDLIASLHIH